MKDTKECRYLAILEIDVWENAGEAGEAQNIIETELEGYFPVQDSTPRKWVGSIKVLHEQEDQLRIILHKIVRCFWASKQPCVFAEMRSILSRSRCWFRDKKVSWTCSIKQYLPDLTPANECGRCPLLQSPSHIVELILRLN
jgi:hypothetical protein